MEETDLKNKSKIVDKQEFFSRLFDGFFLDELEDINFKSCCISEQDCDKITQQSCEETCNINDVNNNDDLNF